MDLHLRNKVVLVTGGARGIGEAIVRLLADEGAIPVIVDMRESLAQTLADSLGEKRAESLVIAGDLSDPSFCESVISQTLTHFGRLDALVNNAGRNDGIGLENGSPDAFLNSLKSNLWHYYNLAHFALPALKESHGNIINIASKTAVTGQGGTSGYVAAKGGILGLTREWAVELLPYQIRVNAVIPAETWTPLYAEWIETLPNAQEMLNKITANIPLGKRMTTPLEIANMVVFMLSDRSAHTTGQFLFVDGGYTHLDRSI